MQPQNRGILQVSNRVSSGFLEPVPGTYETLAGSDSIATRPNITSRYIETFSDFTPWSFEEKALHHSIWNQCNNKAPGEKRQDCLPSLQPGCVVCHSPSDIRTLYELFRTAFNTCRTKSNHVQSGESVTIAGSGRSKCSSCCAYGVVHVCRCLFQPCWW